MKTTPLVRSLLILTLLLASGCGDWMTRRPSNSGLLIEPADAARIGYAISWSTDLGVPRRNRLSSITRLGDLLITVEAPSNLVSAISVRDGSVLWRRVIGAPTENVYAPVRDGERVYLNNDTTVFTLGAVHGDLIASSKLKEIVSTGPVLIGKYAIFGGSGGTVYAHDVQAGYAKWSYQMTNAVVVQPMATEQNVFVADSNGIYAALRAEDGDLLFRGRTFGPVTAETASTRSSIYIASQDQSLYALNRLTGADKWVYRTKAPLTQPPVAIGQSVYLPVPGAGLVALDASNGKKRWHTVPSTPVKASEGRLLLHSTIGLFQVDESTGRVIEQADTGALQKVLQGPDNSLLIVSPGGRIHRLNPKR
jgi:outer membrane protein assembly factor BamB